MIYRIKTSGRKASFNMPSNEKAILKLIRKMIGHPIGCFNCLGFAMYHNEEADVDGAHKLNETASKLAEMAIFGNVVIVGDHFAPLTNADIALIEQKIEETKNNKIYFPPPDHETYY